MIIQAAKKYIKNEAIPLLNIIDLSTILEVTSVAEENILPKSMLSKFVWDRNGKLKRNALACSNLSGMVSINKLICSSPVTIIGIRNKNPIKRVDNSTIAEASERVSFLNLLHNLSTIGFKEQDITNDAKNKIAISLICAIKIMNKIAKTKNIKFLIPTYLFKKLIINTPKYFFLMIAQNCLGIYSIWKQKMIK